MVFSGRLNNLLPEMVGLPLNSPAVLSFLKSQLDRSVREIAEPCRSPSAK